ncbi:3-hydroxyacyl-CoA dehydrogenase [Melanogaster broomeanus]|nr:3-hydroxyacyl-CoA dehydrogenase [Melanogaster broomeanus]
MSIAHGIKQLGVLGAGQMGTGIAFVSALRAKVPVLLHDASRDQLTNSLTFVDKLLSKDVSKGRLTSTEAAEAKHRIQIVDSLHAMRDVDLVVEAVSENLELKRSLLPRLRRPLFQQGVSGASEEGKKAASRVVGLHFFNPVPVMKLVELISAVQTSKDTLDRSRAFAEACGKEVATSQDVPGFVSNALLMPFINEAIMCLEKGVATRDDIDKTFRLGMAHPMGPLQLVPTFVLLERMVDAQWLGKKSGRGFYEYNDN